MHNFSKLLVDRPATGVLRLLINRPEKRNAIDFDVRQQLTEVFQNLASLPDVRAVILGGVGGHFSAGGDLPSMVGLSEDHARARMHHIANLCQLVYGAETPIVTAMEGISAGACIGLSLLCDHIVAGEGTKIIFPFMKLGLVPDWGTLYTLPRRVGISVARRILTSGAVILGPEAQELSLIDEVVPDLEVMLTAVRRAEELAALPRKAFKYLKRRLNFSSASFAADLQREESDQVDLLQSAEFREGYAAFAEKRVADFTRLSSQAS